MSAKIRRTRELKNRFICQVGGRDTYMKAVKIIRLLTVSTRQREVYRRFTGRGL